MAEKNVDDVHDVQSLLSSPERNHLIRNNGDQVAVNTLNGKKVGLYFSASWCGPCQSFTPSLIDVYNKLADKGDFEIVYISADEDEESFNGYFSKMPWLAVPFSDTKTREALDGCFKVIGIPHLVILDESGKVLTDRGDMIIEEYGPEGYPFTAEHMAELEAKFAEMAKDWPNKLKHDLHPEHELVLTRSEWYECDGCDKEGKIWAYNCEDCNFDLHPDCALKETNGKDAAADAVKEGDRAHEGWVCDGDVCYKAS